MQGPITVDELERAKRGIAKREQEMVFPAEIKALKEGKSMSHQSCLIYFNPFIDKDNLIRIGGRLKHAEINASIKHPILLPERSKFGVDHRVRAQQSNACWNKCNFGSCT